MLAIVAAVLFALALIFDLARISVEILTSQFLVTAGLLCLALYLAGIGSRTLSTRRR